MAYGARVGDLVIGVDKGKSKDTSQSLLQKYKANILSCTIIINSTHNVMAHIVYKNSKELFNLIESIRSMEYVNDVQWSEVVEVIESKVEGDRTNKSEVIKALFNLHQNNNYKGNI